jgi:flagellar hook-basal body complex protein FliE
MIDRINPATASPVASSLEAGPADLVRGAAATAAPSTEGADFGAMLSTLASNAIGAVKEAETISLAGVRSEASVQQVVEAVMSAEQTLHSALAIRDKVVSAYLEISRMSI